MQTAPVPRPFPLPSDLDSSRSLTRAMTARILQEIKSQPGAAERLVGQSWPRDVHAKAATTATTTTTAAALSPTVIGGFVAGLVPQSAAARLMAAGIRVNLDGVGTVTLPRASTNPLPSFVAEAAPIPVAQPVISNATVGPARKLSMIEVLTAELADYSAESAELVIRTMMTEAASRALDAAVFSNAAASSSRPAGILNGISALTATAGGGANALIGDIGQLVAAITTAGGGTRLMIFAPPAKAAIIPIYSSSFAIEIVPTPALAPSTIIVLDPQAFASGFGPDPQIDVASETVLHFEDTTPLDIATGPQGSAVVASPSRSMYQTQSYGLRLTLRVAWCMRAPLVAWTSSVTW